MEREEILSLLKDIIAETLDIDQNQIKEDTRLEEDLGCDSLDGVEIALALEDELDIDMEDGNFNDFSTVSDIVEYLESVLA